MDQPERPASRRRTRLRLVLLAATATLCLLVPGTVFAGDGVIELNQAAANAGTLSGEAAGLPITISLPDIMTCAA